MLRSSPAPDEVPNAAGVEHVDVGPPDGSQDTNRLTAEGAVEPLDVVGSAPRINDPSG
jgi:hypothetical protein